jgi:hypothetical protein
MTFRSYMDGFAHFVMWSTATSCVGKPTHVAARASAHNDSIGQRMRQGCAAFNGSSSAARMLQNEPGNSHGLKKDWKQLQYQQ